MRTAHCKLESLSPYSQSKHVTMAKLDKELAGDYEARTWRERCHVNEDGHVFIPPMAFKNCLAEAAAYLSIKIPGKRNATYSKHFLSGVLVVDPVVLPETKETVLGEWLFLNADGKRGSGTRVDRCYPHIPKWAGVLTAHVLDDTITPDAFAQHLREAGNLIGIGRFRPRNGGFYGRFKVNGITWE